MTGVLVGTCKKAHLVTGTGEIPGADTRPRALLFLEQIDEDKSGEISLWELFEALEMKQSKFTKRIFR